MKYLQNYNDIKNAKQSGLRSFLRSKALSGLYLKEKLLFGERFLSKPRIQFLYIHHVFKDEEENLKKLINFLQQDHAFISYSEAVNLMLERKIQKPSIVFSLDDGFKNNMKASAIFDEFGISACFFINPDMIGQKDYDKIKEHCKTKLNLPPIEFMDWDDIADLQKRGHEIGAHTMAHIKISSCSINQVKEDLEQNYQILLSKCGVSKHFAFPYGRFFHFNETARKICFDTGYFSCATAERGCHINHQADMKNEELCILRDHVILDWNLNHIKYFLINNSKKANTKNNLFPYA